MLELKDKVLNKGLDWIVLDDDMANESLKENNENYKKYGFHTSNNKTGIKNVHKSKNHNKQGFSWRYAQIINKNTNKFSSFDLIKLKDKVLANGFNWVILDKKLAKESFKENEENMKRFYKN